MRKRPKVSKSISAALSALGRLGGSTKSDAQTEARRRNAAKAAKARSLKAKQRREGLDQ